MLVNDIDRVATAISRKYGHRKKDSFDYGWSMTSALCTMDCVLSLNRRYDAFVYPRIVSFKEKNPQTQTLEHLRDLMGDFQSPGDFMQSELNYNDIARARVLSEVIDYLLYEQTEYTGDNEFQRLTKWAGAVRPGDAFFTGIKGFGLAGFQYLRMHFGAQTAKPDVHIQNFISDIVGRRVNDVTSLVILERAAKKSGLSLRTVDSEIWIERARR